MMLQCLNSSCISRLVAVLCSQGHPFVSRDKTLKTVALLLAASWGTIRMVTVVCEPFDMKRVAADHAQLLFKWRHATKCLRSLFVWTQCFLKLSIILDLPFTNVPPNLADFNFFSDMENIDVVASDFLDMLFSCLPGFWWCLKLY